MQIPLLDLKQWRFNLKNKEEKKYEEREYWESSDVT